MSEQVEPHTPAGLHARGDRRWREVTGKYELSGGELETLLQMCRLYDRADLLAKVVERDGPMIEGSTGQWRVHPAIAEERQLSLAAARLEAQLALPDDEGETLPSVTALRARKAADARWQPHRRDVAARVALGTE